MQQAWNDLLAFYKKYVSVESLGKGASLEELTILEYYLNQPLPMAFKEFYQIHNGWREFVIEPHPSRLLSVNEILKTWSEFNAFLSLEAADISDVFENLQTESKQVQNVVWHSGWIPFTVCTRGRDHYCLDFAPTVFGKAGQIIFFSRDLGDRTFISESFEVFIKNYTAKLPV